MSTTELRYRPYVVCIAAAVGICALVTSLSRDSPEDASESGDDTTSIAQVTPGHTGVFRDATAECKLNHRHVPGETDDFYFPQIMAPGCALADFNVDGRLDIYLLNGGLTEPASVEATTLLSGDMQGRSGNQLYLQTADGTFRNATRESGLDDADFSMGVAVGDVNNDGLPDLYVTNVERDRLYLNSASGQFLDVTGASGVDNQKWSASATFVDVNLDGWLDLYVTNYVQLGEKQCRSFAGNDRDFCGPSAFPSVADRLYLNTSGSSACVEGAICFSDISIESGIAAMKAPGLGVVAGDFNSDGRPDLYVANDQTANHLWINQGENQFENQAVEMGCAFDSEGRAQAGMGVVMADLNANGFQDLFVTHLDGESSTFYEGDRHGFRDRSGQTGITSSSLKTTGFGVAAMDIDNDTDLDLVVANGRVKRPARKSDSSTTPSDDFWADYRQHNTVLFNGDGFFRAILEDSNAFTRQNDVSRGLATGDINRDGAIDLLVSNSAGLARIYLNNADDRGNWLSFDVLDAGHGKRYAYGAWITLTSGDLVQRKIVGAGSGYCSSSSPSVHFGLGESISIDSIEIQWPDGRRELFQPIPINGHYRIVGGVAASDSQPQRLWGDEERVQ